MKVNFLLFVLLGLFGPCLAFSAELPRATVIRHPSKITRHQFDPQHPSPGMPRLKPPEAGVCHFEFIVESTIRVSVGPKGSRTVEVEVDAVSMILDLPIDIWLMKNASAKLVKHEEGHRKICEDYYGECKTIARELARKMVGRKITVTGRSKEDAQNKAQDRLLSELNQDYMRLARTPCRICQDHYDDLTEHGLAAIDEATAIVKAKALQRSGQLPSTEQRGSISRGRAEN